MATGFLVGGNLIFIIQQMYALKHFQIVDAPKWISDWNCRFDINAKGNPSASSEELGLMAQALLAEKISAKGPSRYPRNPLLLAGSHQGTV